MRPSHVHTWDVGLKPDVHTWDIGLKPEQSLSLGAGKVLRRPKLDLYRNCAHRQSNKPCLSDDSASSNLHITEENGDKSLKDTVLFFK